MSAPVGVLKGITIDVADLDRAIEFWGRVLQVGVRHREEPYVWLDEVSPGVVLVLQWVGEEKTSKTRMHLDLSSEDPDGLISAIQSWGGRLIEEVDEASYSLTVMADPDGNEFCVSRRLSTVLASRARMQ